MREKKPKASGVIKMTKSVGPPKKKKEVIIRGGKGIRSALIQTMRAKAGWKVDSQKAAVVAAQEVPERERAGVPIKGGFPLEKWAEKFPEMVVDLGRAAWLPDDWGQGVKTTTPNGRSTGTGGGMLVSFISPEGRRYFHKYMVEQICGRKLSALDGFRGQMRVAHTLAWQNRMSAIGSDAELLKLLSPKERKHLPPASELYVAVVSARRATKPEGMRDIATVQAQFTESGVEPVWYVDKDSLQDYKALGLKAVVGGKLTPARNLALVDAQRKGKVCVQVSDDVSRWEYRHGKRATDKSDDAQNAAHNAAKRLVISPVAAARFMLAKMRSMRAEGKKQAPRLAGVYPLGSCARAFAHDEQGMHHFILGDFLVVDKSPVRFDNEMTLKEDYDFTCAHITKHGAVMRFNRLTIAAKHQTNDGGAVTQRDKKGKEEDKNIEILKRKWPKAFHKHPHRKHEVVMRWPGSLLQGEDEDDEERSGARKVKKRILKK